MLVVEAERRIPWTKPVDIEVSDDTDSPKLGGHVGGGFFAAFADGSVKFVPKDTDPSTLRALFSKAGGEAVKLR